MKTIVIIGGSLLHSDSTNTTTPPSQPANLTLPSSESPSHKKRMRKKSTKKKIEKKIDAKNYDELVEAKDRHIANGSTIGAIKYLEQMIKLCNDITKLAQHLLELADLYFIDGDFKKAARLYTEFATLYPGNEKMEYALYRAICSSYALILSSDRDQTKTEETVGLTEIFLIQDHFVTYKEEVKQIQHQCYQQLATSECNICSFYLTRDRFTAVEKRLKKIRENWLPKLPSLETEIIALETQLATQKEAAELLQLKNIERASHKQLYASRKKTKRLTERF